MKIYFNNRKLEKYALIKNKGSESLVINVPRDYAKD